jgi:hypothetical protein
MPTNPTDVQETTSFTGLAEGLTLAGEVTAVNAEKGAFTLRCRSGDVLDIAIVQETKYQVLTNIDNVNRDRIPQSDIEAEKSDPVKQLVRYVVEDALLFVRCVYQQSGEKKRLEAQTIYLLTSVNKRKNDGQFSYVFEEGNWWLTQTTQLADRWLDNLFKADRNYSVGEQRAKNRNFQVQIPDDATPREDGSIDIVVEFKIKGDRWARDSANESADASS